MSYTVNDIRQHFDSATFSRGDNYRRNGNVRKAERDGNTIQGSVSGNQARPYKQTIQLRASGSRLRFDGHCSCPMAHNCKHVVAVLLTLHEREPVIGMGMGLMPAPARMTAATTAAAPVTVLPPAPPALAEWMGQLTLAARAAESAVSANSASAAPAKASHCVAYALMPDPNNKAPLLLLCKGKLDAAGAVVSLTPVPDLFDFNHFRPDYADIDDIGPARPGC